MRRVLAAATILAGFVAATPAGANDAKPVIELFTSQGDSSCPPADALLVELAARGDVIALSEHVDYWNYIGWTDPFSAAGSTERQQSYRKALNIRYVYTPQMVIDGVVEVVGSERHAVEQRLAQSRGRARITMEVSRTGGRATVRIPANQTIAKGAAVWMFDIDGAHTTRISRGENKGKTLTNANVVRGMTRIGTYNGEAMEIPVDAAKLREKGRAAAAILVQSAIGARIFGAVLVTAGAGP